MPLFHGMYGRERPDDAIRMILHGGPMKGCEAPVSSPDPVAERGPVKGFVIEIAVDELERIDPACLPRIDRAWLHDHNKPIRRLPDLLWELPNLAGLSVTDSRLNAQLFRRGLPDGVAELRITGHGRFQPKGPPSPNLLLLNALEREFHPRLDPAMFPNLEGLQVHVGRKSDKKDRREMWEVILGFPHLKALGVARADGDLDWTSLPAGLTRLWLGNGDLSDLAPLVHLNKLTYLHLHFLKSLLSLKGLGAFQQLETLVLIGCDDLSDVSAITTLPKLKEVNGVRRASPAVAEALKARGVLVRS